MCAEKNLSPEELFRRYPQLNFPVRQGMKDTPEYRAAVLRGEETARRTDFSFAPEDTLTMEDTPAGKAEVLFLEKRGSFEHVVRVLAHRCEPVEIPPYVGAMTLRGLIDWGKINRRREEYLAAGNEDWDTEFGRFTADKKNYLGTILLLSSGDYSAVPAGELGLEAGEWRRKSLLIRKYHELTHFVCRELFPEDIAPVRDEVIADFMGIIAAFGRYDPLMAMRFLGTERRSYRDGGRLVHYVEREKLEHAAEAANALIARLDGLEIAFPEDSPLDGLPTLFGQIRDFLRE